MNTTVYQTKKEMYTTIYFKKNNNEERYSKKLASLAISNK